MRRHMRSMALLLALTTLLKACATTRHAPSVARRDVKVVRRADGPKVHGELLVVEPDRVVVLAKEGIHDVAIPAIRQIRAHRVSRVRRQPAGSAEAVRTISAGAALRVRPAKLAETTDGEALRLRSTPPQIRARLAQ